MITLPVNQRTLALARRLVWFEPPEQALSDATRFLAYAFAYARAYEMDALREWVDDTQLRTALRDAPPGIIDPRSWAYWHLMLDLAPGPQPQRVLPQVVDQRDVKAVATFVRVLCSACRSVSPDRSDALVPVWNPM